MSPTLQAEREASLQGRRTLLRLATAGSVDDGKSTLVGRLLFDTNSVLSDTLDSIETASRRKGLDRADLALLTDGLRAEREQGITIDVAYRYFATAGRKFVLADCPGHVQYTRNTVTGASTAHVIILLVDARKGVMEQTRRHLAVAALLRVPHVVLAVNKIDLVDFSETVFDEIATDFALLARTLGVRDSHAIPVSALEGDNVVTRSSRMPWYEGPTVLGYLESVDDTSLEVGEDFRFPVQSVVRPQSAVQAPWAASAPVVDGDYRGYAGLVAAGRVSVGEEVVVLPVGSHATIAGIDTPDGPLDVAVAGQSVVLRLDRDLDISRGAILTSTDAPPAPTRDLTGTVSWLTDRTLAVGQRVLVQHGTSLTKAVVKQIDGVLDLDFDARSAPTWRGTDALTLNDIGRVRLTLAAPLPVDPYKEHRGTGSFILVDEADGWTLAAGMAGPTSLRTLDVDPHDTTAEPVTS
ncbi:sulfate adenylyltransferase subunit 1 [Microlunatus antarcticus]|uniref:sulfate adenylyltransferase n=1 Tax=Microlunatus antarcticus TaxID=53388 RepID=A0A7W5P6U7_9ACTN|nr:GTP-binding protein [Microlunatus antarcticus]MBB3326722.1 sulfate adenylyltransferase subunit 1 [Microlunatus antarcticus]